MTHIGVILMTYGSPATLDDIPVYIKNVYGGREPSQEVLTEFRRRYALIGGSPLIRITNEQAAALQKAEASRFHPDNPGREQGHSSAGDLRTQGRHAKDLLRGVYEGAAHGAGEQAGGRLRADRLSSRKEVDHSPKRAREMIVEMDHPLMGRVRALGQPAKFSASRPGAYGLPAPWLGQHTEQVLRDELGLTSAELEELTKAGVAYNKHPEASQ